MKKIILSLAVVTAMVCFSSCGGGAGFESDVRKAAKMRCDMEKLQAKAEAGDEAAKKEMEEKAKELRDFAEKMNKKYEKDKDNKEMDAKADKIMDEEMAKCADKK